MPALAPPAIRADSGSGVPPAAARHPGDADLAAPGIWLCSGGQLPDGLWAAVCGRAPSPGLRADPVPADPGFCQGGVLDALRPGPELALLLPGAGDLPGLGDEELTGMVRGWRRLASWAAAMEHATVTELASRRIGEATGAGARASEAERYASAEVAAALTLTQHSAEALVGRALSLADLPGTWAALASGLIDMPKALVILTSLAGLDAELSRRVEALVLRKAPTQTTGELRKEAARAVIAADPDAADQRQAEAERSARVERWAEPAGTGAIAGRDLPAAEVIAADNRVNALAAALKADGALGGMDFLRAQVFLGLLLGRPVAAPAQDPVRVQDPAPAQDPVHVQDSAPAQGPVPAGSVAPGQGTPVPSGSVAPAQGLDHGQGLDATQHLVPARDSDAARPAGLVRRVAALSGSINLTVPLQTLLGLAKQPAEVAGFGPVTSSTLNGIIGLARGSPAVRWCVTVTDGQGQAAWHGCAARGQGKVGSGRFTVKLEALAVTDCAHQRESAGYKPSPSLRHLIEIRNQTCVFPGCGRPARQCDCDHTIPFHKGGLSCECNIAPVCRSHHKIKQVSGWRLEQPRPGVLQWSAPSGWKYTTTPDAYPG